MKSSMPKFKESLLKIQDRTASSKPSSSSPSNFSVANCFNLYTILCNPTSIKQRWGVGGGQIIS